MVIQNDLYSRENVLNMISAMRNLIDDSAVLFNKYKNMPNPESIAIREWNDSQNKELIKDVCYRGILSMESAADHLMAYADSISEPAKTIAPWTCVRGLLESCALALWFLDPNINAHERLSRCFAFRYSGFMEQKKFLRVDNATIEIEKVERRIKKVEQDAILLGYAPVLNKKGEIDGIAQSMPSIIDLIRRTLNREGEYRLLSGIAHGHHWAIGKMGFRVCEEEYEDNNDLTYEKYLHPEIVLFATDIAVSAFANVLWYLWQLYGWNEEEIKNLLNKIYDQLHYKKKQRFWNSIR